MFISMGYSKIVNVMVVFCSETTLSVAAMKIQCFIDSLDTKLEFLQLSLSPRKYKAMIFPPSRICVRTPPEIYIKGERIDFTNERFWDLHLRLG